MEKYDGKRETTVLPETVEVIYSWTALSQLQLRVEHECLKISHSLQDDGLTLRGCDIQASVLGLGHRNQELRSM